MAKKKTLTATYNELPLIARLIIQILGGYLVSGIYRIVRYLETKNVLTLVVGILGICTGVGNLIVWLADLITLILKGKYVYFAD